MSSTLLPNDPWEQHLRSKCWWRLKCAALKKRGRKWRRVRKAWSPNFLYLSSLLLLLPSSNINFVFQLETKTFTTGSGKSEITWVLEELSAAGSYLDMHLGRTLQATLFLLQLGYNFWFKEMAPKNVGSQSPSSICTGFPVSERTQPPFPPKSACARFGIFC